MEQFFTAALEAFSMTYFELDGVAYRFSSKKMSAREIKVGGAWDLEEIHGEIWEMQVFDLQGNLIWQFDRECWPSCEDPVYEDVTGLFDDFLWDIHQVSVGNWKATECPRFGAPSLLTL